MAMENNDLKEKIEKKHKRRNSYIKHQKGVWYENW